MPCYHARRNSNRSAKRSEEKTVTIKKPIVPPFNRDLFKGYSICIFVGSSRSCNDPNRYVDHVIKWLLEDGLNVEKTSSSSPLAKKFNVTATPHVIIFNKQEPKTRIQWKGVGIVYKAIVNYLVSKL